MCMYNEYPLPRQNDDNNNIFGLLGRVPLPRGPVPTPRQEIWHATRPGNSSPRASGERLPSCYAPTACTSLCNPRNREFQQNNNIIIY